MKHGMHTSPLQRASLITAGFIALAAFLLGILAVFTFFSQSRPDEDLAVPTVFQPPEIALQPAALPDTAVPPSPSGDSGLTEATPSSDLVGQIAMLSVAEAAETPTGPPAATPSPAPSATHTLAPTITASPTATATHTPPPTAAYVPQSTPVVIQPAVEVVPEQVVIRFDAGTTPQQRRAYVASIGGTVKQEIGALDALVVNVAPGVAAQDLAASSHVVASEPDYYVTALDNPDAEPYSDPYYAEQWALPVIGAPDAWASLPADAPQITVAVIDSGVCAGHLDLQGRLLDGWDFLEDDPVPQDDFGHGCAVTGVIAANMNDSIGMAGVAPNVQIMPLRVLDAQGVGSYSDVAAAIVYAVDHGVAIINLSLGGTFPSATLENAIHYADTHGVMVVAAAGNTGQLGVLYPAAYDPVIAVGSVDPDLQQSSFSSYGPEIDLLAPGRDILTAHRNGDYSLVSGTSFAAPHVAGVAALESAAGHTLVVDGTIVAVGGWSSGTPMATPEPTASPTTTPDDTPGDGDDAPPVLSGPTEPPRTNAELIPLAEQRGQLRVIVGVNVDHTAEGALAAAASQPVTDSAAIRAQRAQIASARALAVAQMAPEDVIEIIEWQSIPYFAVETNAAGIQALLRSPYVRVIIEDQAVPPTMGYSLDLINAAGTGGAWDLGVDGTDFAVAVLDSGAQSNHDFLNGKIVHEACWSTNSANSISICPGNVASVIGSGAASPYECVTQSGVGECDHGTHVSGTVAGNYATYNDASQWNEPQDLGGVAKGADIISIQVFSIFTSETNCGAGAAPCSLTTTSDQLSALDYVYNTLAATGPGAGSYNIAAVNMSLGGGQYSSACDLDARASIFANLVSVGIAPIAATGNNGWLNAMNAPACITDAVSVGASDINYLNGPDTYYLYETWPDNNWCQINMGETCYGTNMEQVAEFSNSSVMLDMLAPGYFIESAKLGATSGTISQFTQFAGTSMAAPHVAGAWAVLKQQSPVAPVSRILTTLQSTGVQVTDAAYTGNDWSTYPPAPISKTYRSGALGGTYSRIDVGAAVVALGRDYGDAPDPYSTYNASNGPRHIRVPEYYLGAGADSEGDGQPTDNDTLDDGVIFSSMTIGETVYLDVTASVAQMATAPAAPYLGSLNGWIDFNHDGDFDDAGEQVVTDQLMTGPYPQAIPVTIPADAIEGTTWARFRYSTQTGLSYTGEAYNGEVEDYQITLGQSVAPVRVVDVFTTDENGTAAGLGVGDGSMLAQGEVQAEAIKTEFNLGEPIGLYLYVVNDLATNQTATAEWRVTDPNGEVVPELSWTEADVTYEPGHWHHWIDRTIPMDSIRGDYTFEGFVTHNGEMTSASVTFHVIGASINSVFTTDDGGTASGLDAQGVLADEAQAAAYKTDFNLGDPIQLYIDWTNEFTGGETVTLNWSVTDPAGQPVVALSGTSNVSVGSGNWWHYISRTIPADSLDGDYTFTGEVTYEQVSTTASTTFHVNGIQTVKVVDVYTTDSSGEILSLDGDPQVQTTAPGEVSAEGYQTSFNAGDAMRMYLVSYNNVAADETALLGWYVIDPWGRRVPELEWASNYTVSFGKSWWFLSRYIPDHAVTGDYTLHGEVTYNGDTTSETSTFYVTGPPGPAHQDFDAAQLIGAVPYQDTVDTWNAATAGDDPVPSCGSGVTNTVWYQYVGDGSPIMFHTNESDFDTVLSVWTGTRGSLAEVACDNNGGAGSQSAITLNAASGTTYYLMVGGQAGASGMLQFAATRNGITERISVASDGTQGNDHSSETEISADGRYVVFASWANNLIVGDTNGKSDIFVHDWQTDTTTRVSTASDGTQANDSSSNMEISADGRYVAFASSATNLVSGDTNGAWDIFVHDRQTGETTRVSVASDGMQGNDRSYDPAISSDGRYVVFYSYASNLVADDTNGFEDVFMHDRQTGATTRVSLASDGTQGNGTSHAGAISADGRYVAFASSASNLVIGDTNGTEDVFVHDRQTGETVRVSLASDGTQGNNASASPDISADGRYVAFHSSASNLVSSDTNAAQDVFVHHRQTGATTRVSLASDGTQGESVSEYPDISSDGRYVSFTSYVSNLVPGDTNNRPDVFVHDRQTGATTRISLASDGTQANDTSGHSAISADGRYVAFYSVASNLVSSDTNDRHDGFVHQRLTSPVSLPRPLDLNATGVSGVEISLAWADTSADETAFHIERSPDGSTGWTEIGTVGTGVTTYADDTLTCETEYFYRVRAYRSGDGVFSEHSNVARASTDLCPTNLVRNGDFAAGETEWSFWGQIGHSVVSEVMEMYRETTSPDGAAMFQAMNYAIPTGSSLEVSLTLGNPSGVAKEMWVTARNSAWTGVMNCHFTLPAGAAPDTYTLRGETSMEWDNIWLELSPGPADSVAAITVDDVSLQYLPGLSVSGVECVAPTVSLPEATNLVRNGDFAAGETEWSFWGQIGHSVVSEVMEMYRETTSPDGAAMFQALNYVAPAGSPLEVSLLLGNPSGVAKEMWVTARDSAWTGVMNCHFTLPAGVAPDTYTLRGETSMEWDNIWLELSPGPADSVAAITVDDVSLQYLPGLSVTGVECDAPVTALPEATNLVRNGDFSAGEAEWSFWGQIGHSVVSEVMEMYRETTSPDGAAMFQALNYVAPAGSPLEVSLLLGNPSGVAKEMWVTARDSAWTGVMTCHFTLPAGAAPDTYTLRGETSMEWDNIWLELSPGPADSIAAITMDDVSLQYLPGLSVTGVECDVPATAPPEATNLVRNGDFAAGETEWSFWGQIGHSVVSEVMEMYRETTSPDGAAMFQALNYVAPAGSPLEVSLLLGNPSGVAKEMWVTARDSAWTGVMTCHFDLPAGTAPDTYLLRGATSAEWDNIVLELSPGPADSVAAITVDDVSLQYLPGLSVTGVECVAPATALPEATNLVRNGDFSAGEAEWSFWGQIGHSVVSEVMEMHRETTSPDGAAMFQALNYVAPAGSPLEVSLLLGNPSGVAKEMWVTARDSAWTGVMNCHFTLPAGAAPDTYTLRGETSMEWDNIWLELSPGPADSVAAITVDDVSLQYLPGLSVTGVECGEPGALTVFTDEEATPEPPVEPADASLQIVEADAAAVQQTGTWNYHASAFASGGGYLFSGGGATDTLMLAFSGTRVELVYVQHPSLGGFSVRVDGVDLRQVTSSGAQAFGQRVVIDGLATGEHTVQVVPHEGHTIAIDAFAVEAVTMPAATATPPPPAEPTIAPTSFPPAESTAEPTARPASPTATETPLPSTETPLPTATGTPPPPTETLPTTATGTPPPPPPPLPAAEVPETSGEEPAAGQ